MLKHKAYKFRIYPNKTQANQIDQTIGCARFVYNEALSLSQKMYSETGKGLSYSVLSARLPGLKKESETQWLGNVDSTALQASLKDLESAYDRFFKKQNGFPSFKKKFKSALSYTTKNNADSIRIEDGKIKLPKLNWVRFAQSQKIKGRILNVTVRQNTSQKYFISVLTEEIIKPLPKTHSSIGIDLGLTDFAILSDGVRINNPYFTKRHAQKLAREQRKLSKRALLAKANGIRLSDARNYQKQKLIVARLHQKMVDQRQDFQNKLSTDLIKNHDIICIEDLNVKSMMKNKQLAKGIGDVSWSSFVRQLQYKADWYGKTLVKIDRWYPSSQICSVCSHHDGKKALNLRTWTCSQCATSHDRDINASRNILAEGLRLLTV